MDQDQPNFTIVAEQLHIVADEIGKCVNLPAIQDGATILQSIESMERRLTLRIQAVEVNAISRLQNRMLYNPDQALSPLYDTQNEMINGFPKTPSAINQLNVLDMDRIFQSLGAPSDGSLAAKRKRIRLLAGLRDDLA